MNDAAISVTFWSADGSEPTTREKAGRAVVKFGAPFSPVFCFQLPDEETDYEKLVEALRIAFESGQWDVRAKIKLALNIT